MIQQIKNPYFFAVLSGILLSLSWLPQFGGVWQWVAWLPLLYADDLLLQNKQQQPHFKAFWLSYLAFGIWNFISFWWSAYAHIMGLLSTTFVNSLLMAVVFWAAHLIRRKINPTFGRFIFIIAWLSFEYVHFRWELAFPWLTLGNAFAKDTWAVQWYEYTGVLGGSLWILLINVLLLHLYYVLTQSNILKQKVFTSIVLFALVAFPVFMSIKILHSYQEKGTDYEVLIIQPNSNPYYQYKTYTERQNELNRILHIADTAMSSKTNFVLFPENSIPLRMWENSEETFFAADTIKNHIAQNQQVVWIGGATTFYKYAANEKISSTARLNKRAGFYFDVYNSALQFSNADSISVYHKSRLLIGPEKVPFLSSIGFVSEIIQKAGGMSGSFGVQHSAENFVHTTIQQKVAPIICWESIFGEYVSEFVQQGAGTIFILTNDGWWRNTAGHTVHLHLSRLRAIENRRSIARAALTGTSAIINQKGEIVQSTNYNEVATLRATIKWNTQMTFYTKNGDSIGRISLMLLVLMSFYSFVQLKIKHKQ